MMNSRLAAARVLWCSFCAAAALAQLAAAQDAIDIGNRRELFVDDYVIDRLDGAELKMHAPCLAAPGEKRQPNGHYATVLKDGDLFRFYYRGDKIPGAHWRDGWDRYHLQEVTLCAESEDGVNWTMPDLNRYELEEFPAGNVVLDEGLTVNHNFTPFIDTRPGAPADQKYKALGGLGTYPASDSPGRWQLLKREQAVTKYGPPGLRAYVSPDGIHWQKLRDEPVITEGKFDSQNIAFWSETEGCYVCYFRTVENGLRGISRTTSSDFVNWTEPVSTKANAPGEHLYTNGTQPYFRAPHIYIALPTRFQAERGSTTDIMLMSSRGGNRYDRTFMEAFIRPGVGEDGWGNRSNYAAKGVHQTGPFEMSIYLTGRRRYTLRLDGFSSVHAGYEQAEMVTKPLEFAGDELELNYSTSAGGQILVEVQDAEGRPVPGFELEACRRIVGDEIQRVVAWDGEDGGDLGTLSGEPIRLRFVMRDADLFAIRFR